MKRSWTRNPVDTANVGDTLIYAKTEGARVSRIKYFYKQRGYKLNVERMPNQGNYKVTVLAVPKDRKERHYQAPLGVKTIIKATSKAAGKAAATKATTKKIAARKAPVRTAHTKQDWEDAALGRVFGATTGTPQQHRDAFWQAAFLGAMAKTELSNLEACATIADTAVKFYDIFQGTEAGRQAARETNQGHEAAH